jgi:hypothetical protein
MSDYKNPPQSTHKRNPNIPKYDNGLIGALSGLLVIIVAIVIIKFLRHPSYSFANYINFFIDLDNPFLMSEASKILSLALFSLLAPFYFFLNKKCYLATRGVLVMYKFIW